MVFAKELQCRMSRRKNDGLTQLWSIAIEAAEVNRVPLVLVFFSSFLLTIIAACSALDG